MSRNEPGAGARDELAALDRILAGERVGEEHLDLAALVESVRADAPQIDDAFAGRLDRLVAARTAPRAARQRSRSRSARRGWAPLASGGGALAALVLGLAVVLGSGVLNGASNTPLTRSPSGLRALAGSGKVEHATAPGADNFTATGPTASTGSLDTLTPNAGSVNSAAPNPLNPSDQLIQRAASLTLATAPSQMQGVANEVVSTTEQYGGVVEHSNVSVHGASSYSSFNLSIPATKLGPFLSSLSSLAGVRALTQSTQNLTHSYDSATVKLADEKSERAALIKALASAQSTTQAATIQQQINALDTAIAATHGQVGALLSEGHNSNVDVAIVAGSAGAGHSAGPIVRALDDSLAVLDVVLAIALVALAVLLPIALCVLAVWWSAAALRQRSRERALTPSTG
jgi:hypothetical protein